MNATIELFQKMRECFSRSIKCLSTGPEELVIALANLTLVREAMSGLRSLVFPSRCALTAEALADAGEVISSAARQRLQIVGDNYCSRCGAPQGPFVGQIHGCQSCKDSKDGFRLDAAVAAASFDDDFKRLIHALKYGRERRVAKDLGALLAEKILDRGLEAEYVIPVPLGRRRLRERGFNQAEEIARAIVEKAGGVLLSKAIARKKETRQQAMLAPEKRRDNLKGAFASGPQLDQIKGKRVLLVDDVLTSGTTLNEAAKVVRKGKPLSLVGGVVARAT